MHPLFRGTCVIPVLTIERERMRCRSPARSTKAGLNVIEVALRTEAAAAVDRRDRPRAAAGHGRRRDPPARRRCRRGGARRREISRQPWRHPGACRRGAGDRAALSARRRHPVRDHGGARARHLRHETVSGRCARRHRAVARARPGFPRRSHSARPAGSTSAALGITWRCPTCRWSAARGWRRATPSPPATGRVSAASPNAPQRSATPRRLKTVNWLLVVQSFSIENSRNIFFHSCFSRLRLFG